jgi:hypothetical protein
MIVVVATCDYCGTPHLDAEPCSDPRALVHGPCAWCGSEQVAPGESLCPHCQQIEAQQ